MSLFGYLSVFYFVIPVLDTGIQHFHTISLRTLFLYNTFVLTSLVKSWIPVSEHWDDTLLVGSNYNVVRAGMAAKSKLVVLTMTCKRQNEKGNCLI
ncbi:MAG: hypothetical protein ACR5K9_03790 [Wolbachia sp.]